MFGAARCLLSKEPLTLARRGCGVQPVPRPELRRPEHLLQTRRGGGRSVSLRDDQPRLATCRLVLPVATCRLVRRARGSDCHAPGAAPLVDALRLRILQLECGQVVRPDVADLEDVARHLEDRTVVEEGALLLDGDSLEDLLHVDRRAAVVESAGLLHLLGARQRDALLLG